MAVTYGKGFRNRLAGALAAIQSGSIEHDLLVDLALLDRAEAAQIPRSLIVQLYGGASERILANTVDLTKVDRMGNYRIRAPYFAEAILSKTSQQTRLARVERMARAICPQVDEDTVDSWYGLFQALMREKTLRKSFRIEGTAIRDLLYRLKGLMDHISYYWLNLGLAEQSCGDFEKALNHLSQAQALRPTAYQIRHAIGRNYLKHAN
jgi:tetratricopeptide (TPR) repeat protein